MSDKDEAEKDQISLGDFDCSSDDDDNLSGWSLPNNEEHLGEKRTRSSDYHLAIRPCKGNRCFDKVSQEHEITGSVKRSII